jgi:tight adherence protein B
VNGLVVASGISAALLVAGLGRMALRSRPPVRPAGVPTRPRPPMLAGHPAGRDLEARLRRAGMPLGADAFALVVVIAGAAAALGGWWLAGSALVVPAGPGLAAVLAMAVVRSAEARRPARMAAELPAVVWGLASSLSAGLSLRQALVRAARDAPAPLDEELRAVVAELDLGARIEAALEDLSARVPARDLRVMVTAILVQRQTGGDLAGALASLAGRLEERAQLARELRGATAQARLTAWMVAALPAGAAIMAEVAAPGTVRGALEEPPGPLLLIVAGGMYAAGVVWVRRIGRVDP